MLWVDRGRWTLPICWQKLAGNSRWRVNVFARQNIECFKNSEITDLSNKKESSGPKYEMRSALLSLRTQAREVMGHYWGRWPDKRNEFASLDAKIVLEKVLYSSARSVENLIQVRGSDSGVGAINDFFLATERESWKLAVRIVQFLLG